VKTVRQYFAVRRSEMSAFLVLLPLLPLLTSGRPDLRRTVIVVKGFCLEPEICAVGQHEHLILTRVSVVKAPGCSGNKTTNGRVRGGLSSFVCQCRWQMSAKEYVDCHDSDTFQKTQAISSLSKGQTQSTKSARALSFFIGGEGRTLYVRDGYGWYGAPASHLKLYCSH
jgi:hypothetical protein